MSNEELAKQWIRSERWGGWRRGMVDARTGQLCNASHGVGRDQAFWVREAFDHTVHYNERYPDLDHPGTRAFLLEDVRAAWGDGYGIDIELASAGFGDRVGVWERGMPKGEPDVFECRAHPIHAALIMALIAAPAKGGG